MTESLCPLRGVAAQHADRQVTRNNPGIISNAIRERTTLPLTRSLRPLHDRADDSVSVMEQTRLSPAAVVSRGLAADRMPPGVILVASLRPTGGSSRAAACRQALNPMRIRPGGRHQQTRRIHNSHVPIPYRVLIRHPRAHRHRGPTIGSRRPVEL